MYQLLYKSLVFDMVGIHFGPTTKKNRRKPPETLLVSQRVFREEHEDGKTRD